MRLLAALACLIAGWLGAAWAAEPQPVVIRFSHVVAPDTPKGKGALMFKQLAEERSGGRVRVEVHPNSTLYKDKDELEALQLGAVQMLAPSLAKLGPLGAREFEVFDLPYIFPSTEVLRAVTDGPIGRSLLKKLESRGILGLAYWDNGFKLMSANRPLLRPEDLRGLKMRIQSSKVLDAQMRALGAQPVETQFSDAFAALKDGIADGTENPPSNMFTQRMHEVQRHATLTNHGYLGYAVLVNQRFWLGLPADLRAVLEDAMAEATRFANDIAERENDEALAAMVASRRTEFHFPTREEKDAWRRALAPVWQAFEARIGKELIAAIGRESERHGFK